MTFILPPQWKRCIFAIAASTVLCAAPSCASFHPYHGVSAPAGSIAVAALPDDRVAILAGDDSAKGIFIEQLAGGGATRSFGVTKEATDVVADDGTLLVSIGGVSADGLPFGAIERWTLAGEKRQVVPLPGPVLALTQAVGGVRYALLAESGGAASAVPLRGAAMQLGPAIPLDPGVRAIQQCRSARAPFLVYSSSAGTITEQDVVTHALRSGSVKAENPLCAEDGRIYALSKTFVSKSIVVIDSRTLARVRTIPVSNRATAISETGRHEVMILDAAQGVANIEIMPEEGSSRPGR